MKLGVTLRVMGDAASADNLLRCARAAEARGFESVWVVDHVAIPPDDAEGSNGRYLDPLTTLAWLAGATERIHIGTSVLVLPYRPPLPTAKAVATLQELSGNRLHLGVGVGWMAPEFRALGVPRRERGQRTDATLAFLRDCFAHDEVSANGQPFLFRPRPPAPPILVGGGGRHALERVIRFGDGWLPLPAPVASLQADLTQLRAMAEDAERSMPALTLLTRLGGDPEQDRADLDSWRGLGAERVIAARRYQDADECLRWLDRLAALKEHM